MVQGDQDNGSSEHGPLGGGQWILGAMNKSGISKAIIENSACFFTHRSFTLFPSLFKRHVNQRFLTRGPGRGIHRCYEAQTLWTQQLESIKPYPAHHTTRNTWSNQLYTSHYSTICCTPQEALCILLSLFPDFTLSKGRLVVLSSEMGKNVKGINGERGRVLGECDVVRLS